MGTLQDIRVFLTQDHACGYWPARQARDLVLDPLAPDLSERYADALALGFRRSGGHVYRPHCRSCHACVPVRLPVARFRPNRAQRRCERANADLTLHVRPAQFTDEHFALYARYLAARHPDSPMADPSPEEFAQFLRCAWSPTRLFELRRGERLCAVAVTDVTPDAISAIYSFFDPDLADRSLGTFCVLSQIAWARATGRTQLYLGFWLDGHPKMDYKRRFQPLERLWQGHWIPFDTDAP
jgi:arginine-tRNA-protein transferase